MISFIVKNDKNLFFFTFQSDVQQKEREIGILSQQLKLSQQKTEELRKTITAKEEELTKGQELIESMRVMNKQMQSESSQMNRGENSRIVTESSTRWLHNYSPVYHCRVKHFCFVLATFYLIIIHVEIVSCDWLTEVHHSMLLYSGDNVTPLQYTFFNFL